MVLNLDIPISKDMFSYKSSLPRNLNHSIRMSDDHVKAKQKHGLWRNFDIISPKTPIFP